MRQLVGIIALFSMTSLAQFTDARGYPGQLQEYLKKDNLHLLTRNIESGTKPERCLEMNLLSTLSECLVMPIALREITPMGGQKWARDGALINLCPDNIKSSLYPTSDDAMVEVTEFKVPRICHVPNELGGNWVSYYVTSASCIGMDCDMSNLVFWDEYGNFMPAGYIYGIGGGRESDEVDLLGDLVQSFGVQIRTVPAQK